MKSLLLILILIFPIGIAYSEITEFDISETYKNKFNFGILGHQPLENELKCKITSYSYNEVLIKWEKPFLFGQDKISEYQIFKRTDFFLGTFQLIGNYSYYSSTHDNFFIDKVNLGFYDYAVIPIIEKHIDKPTNNGLSRNMNSFDYYLEIEKLKAESIFNRLFGNIHNFLVNDKK